MDETQVALLLRPATPSATHTHWKQKTEKGRRGEAKRCKTSITMTIPALPVRQFQPKPGGNKIKSGAETLD